MSRPQHLCIRPLTVRDASQVLALELIGFPPHERASALRIEYRLTTCPELCSGLFVREFDKEAIKGTELPKHSTIKNETLIGQIIATKMLSETVVDESMEVSPSFVSTMCNPDGTLKESYKTEQLKKLEEQDKQKEHEVPGSEKSAPKSTGIAGHVDAGKTIGIHSVVVDPKFQGMKLGSLLLKDYIQKMSQQYVADGITLLCKEKLIKFYSSVGFSDKGVSECRFGGEEWHDMFIVLEHEDDDDDE